MRDALEVEQSKKWEERVLDHKLAVSGGWHWPTEQDTIAEMSQELYGQHDDETGGQLVTNLSCCCLNAFLVVSNVSCLK